MFQVPHKLQEALKRRASAFGWAMVVFVLLVSWQVSPPKGLASPEGFRLRFYEAKPHLQGKPGKGIAALEVKFGSVVWDWLGANLTTLFFALPSARAGAAAVGAVGMGVANFLVGWPTAIGLATYFAWWCTVFASAFVGGWLGGRLRGTFERRRPKVCRFLEAVGPYYLVVQGFGGVVIAGSVMALLSDVRLLGVETNYPADEQLVRALAGVHPIVAGLFVGDPGVFAVCALFWPFVVGLAFILRTRPHGLRVWPLALLVMLLEIGWYFLFPRPGAIFAGLRGDRAAVAAGLVEAGKELAPGSMRDLLHSAFQRVGAWRLVYLVSCGVPIGVLVLAAPKRGARRRKDACAEGVVSEGGKQQ